MASTDGPSGREAQMGGGDEDFTDAPSEPLGRSASAGALWLTGQKWVARLSGIATIAVLTRLIEPKDFGVVAAASTITPFVLLLADLGLSTYVIQARRTDQRLLSTAFWFSISMGTVLCLGLVVAAPQVSAIFQIPETTPVLRALSLSVLLVVLASVPSALLRRRMQFRLLALQGLVATLVAQVVAVVLAFQGAGVWALVAQLTVSQAIACLLVWRAARWHPGFQFSGSQFGELARFGTKVVMVDFVATLRATGEAAIISVTLGAAALGYLSIAQRLVQITQEVGATAITPVSTVLFAKVRASEERLRSAYMKTLRLSYAAVSPIMTGTVVGAPLIVPLIFGDGWDQSVPVAQGLTFAAIFTLSAMLDHGLHYGVGRPGRWLAYAIVVDASTVGVTALAAPHGLPWVAAGFVGVALVATILRWALVGRLLHVPARHLGTAFLTAGVAIAGSGAAGLLVRQYTGELPALASLSLIGLAIGLVHLGLVRIVNPAVFRDLGSVLPARVVSRLGLGG